MILPFLSLFCFIFIVLLFYDFVNSTASFPLKHFITLWRLCYANTVSFYSRAALLLRTLAWLKTPICRTETFTNVLIQTWSPIWYEPSTTYCLYKCRSSLQPASSCHQGYTLHSARVKANQTSIQRGESFKRGEPFSWEKMFVFGGFLYKWLTLTDFLVTILVCIPPGYLKFSLVKHFEFNF